MWNKLKPLLSVIDSISVCTGKFYSFLIVALFGIMTVEVVRRYVFNAPIMGVQDVTAAYFGAYYVMAGAYTLWAKGHVSVDVIYVLFPRRGRAILDLLTFPFFLLFAGALVYTGWKFGMLATWVEGVGWNLEVDQSHLRLPLYPAKWTIAIGSFLLLLQGLAKFVRDLKLAITGEELS
ncbi:MAG TPA: TRAP transporter small permease subunit [Dehalococcoidia bacterium]|nr:TRAP transporter small permease subunit [Dehalococcoidia bacterium]